ncbi:hypothetical protein NJC10_07960 [Micrococcus sp. M4NT]|uniref:D-arabinono-1,4-lactone oxidase n=1 Tax=Micrococcus sp. M4NT TaxID=2957501 RepID=UPI0029A14282|nr:D-arabinono-1,4-lactone oxidase [Micrococcus sp. M4NT]MDX2341595.1 hypothetical protein [Micrococcus sp. M4NT]
MKPVSPPPAPPFERYAAALAALPADERSRPLGLLDLDAFRANAAALHARAGAVPVRVATKSVRTAVMDEFLSNGVFGGMCRLGARAPRLVPLLNQVSARGVDQRTYTDVSYRVFVAERAVRFREMEYAVPLERFEEAFAGLRRIAAERAAAGDAVSFPVEVRTVAADDVWLSTAHGRESAYLAVHRYHREDPTAYFAAAEELFVSLGGRPHWGKEHDRDAEWAARAYPRFADFTAQRDAVDPGRVFANPYLERVLGA